MVKDKISIGPEDLQKAKAHWNLRKDGVHFFTGYNLLQPVSFENHPAMVKIALGAVKLKGIPMLNCWNGNHAVKVFDHHAADVSSDRVIPVQELSRF